jgi:hypothetical protein
MLPLSMNKHEQDKQKMLPQKKTIGDDGKTYLMKLKL